ncbi:MAG: hypothetical protein P1U68_06030 [Verrucomicrobiales bacterium]|nr:hypothetical protein [Verrucomicrobiales bacterium]
MSEEEKSDNEMLTEALENGRIRFFQASRGSASGKTGHEDTALFADNLMTLQECAILLGEKLGMHAVASTTVYEKSETIGFCFDPNSNPQNPRVAGGIVNRRMPFREFNRSIRDFIDR